MAAPKILMLDFDGVLHPSQGSALPDFILVPVLNEALANLACEIVISSTWREHYGLDELRAKLSKPIGERVIDVLGPDSRGPHVRHKTILNWLGQHRATSDWRALDDTASEFPPGCANLILCSGLTGIGPEEASKLRSWLSSGA